MDPFATMNADPEVMRYFPAPLQREQSRASLQHHRALIDERGWGLWAVDVDGDFAGFTGLSIPSFAAPFMPCVEIGWRLRRAYWGQGVAYRAALQAVAYGFQMLQLPELVSFAAAVNLRSRRLMERLDFVHDPADDFEHPAIPPGHELRAHVLGSGSQVLKAGTKAKNIRLVDGDHEIACKIEGNPMALKACFVKKA